MGKRTQRGICSVCGEYGDLTWEHIPPQSAYNDRSLRLLRGMEALNLAPGEQRRGTVQQRGAGGYYTCAHCNNPTGHWYVREFRQWVERGAGILSELGDAAGQDARTYSRFVRVTFFGVKPLLFLKQVVFMLLCINGAGFTAKYPDLRRFVLNRDSKGLPDVCHFHLALTWGPAARQIANTAAGSTATGAVTLMSDISFPPFSYVMWMGQPYGALAPCEITHFASSDASEICDVSLTLQVGFTHLAFPSDYRSRAALEQQAEASRHLSSS